MDINLINEFTKMESSSEYQFWQHRAIVGKYNFKLKLQRSK